MVKAVRFFIMKKFVCMISLLFPLCFVVGQERHVFTVRQQDATHTGDFTTVSAMFSQQVMNRFSIPGKIPKGSYRILTSFILNPDNTISNITILRDPGHGLGEAWKKYLSSISKSASLFDSINRASTDKPVRMNIPINVRVNY